MKSSRGSIVSLALAAVLLGRMPARAGGSAPILSLTSATAVAARNGTRAVTITGTFNFDDTLQFVWPAGLFVTQGSRWVRYDVSGLIREGTSAIVADGITDLEAQALLPLGDAPLAPAAVGQVRVDRITVSLPADFVAGPATAELYGVLPDDPFVSNALALVLP